MLASSSRSSQTLYSPTVSVHDSLHAMKAQDDPALSSESLGVDEDNDTLTLRNSLRPSNGPTNSKSSEELRELAMSHSIVDLGYIISDVHTRIFEIQELRHKSQSSSDAVTTTNIIDQSLMVLDEKLEYIAEGIKSLENSLQAVTVLTPEQERIAHNHASLLSEWEAIQDESEVLREELKEDKWLTVFRTVTEQADGMMSSLEKAVNKCQDFIWQVHRHGAEGVMSSPGRESNKLEMYKVLMESFDAKKRHYVPATTKVLSVIDKGVQDRVTKNGETLRRHAESSKRWKNLKDRIARTEVEMAHVHASLVAGERAQIDSTSSSANLSTASVKNGFLTPPHASTSARKPSTDPVHALTTRRASSREPMSPSTLARSMSPLRTFARKIVGKSPGGQHLTLKSPKATPTSVDSTPETAAETARLKKRASVYALNQHLKTPERPGHSYSQSLTPEWSPQASRNSAPRSYDGPEQATIKAVPKPSPSNIPRRPWNSSTRVGGIDHHIDAPQKQSSSPPSRRPSATGFYRDIQAGMHALEARFRSVSRSSFNSSRPGTPVTSSGSIAPTSYLSSSVSPPSHSGASSRAFTPTATRIGKSPSQIPRPKARAASPISDAGWDDCSVGERSRDAPSPTLSSNAIRNRHSIIGDVTSLRTSINSKMSNLSSPPRTENSSLSVATPVTPSRPSSALNVRRPESRLFSPRGLISRSQTPESSLVAKTKLIPFYQGSSSPRSTARTTLAKVPPSSYRDSAALRSTPSRPTSRLGAITPAFDREQLDYIYTPVNTKDPLDVEVARIVNSTAHGLLIERVDPPLRGAPRPGEELQAKYAISNGNSRKVVNTRLTSMTRNNARTEGKTVTTRKVMVRVGGGWQDLSIYILNRQAGI